MSVMAVAASWSVQGVVLHQRYATLSVYAECGESVDETECQEYAHQYVENSPFCEKLLFETIAQYVNRHILDWQQQQTSTYLRSQETGIACKILLIHGHPFLRFQQGILGRGSFKKVVACLDPFPSAGHSPFLAILISKLNGVEVSTIAEQEFYMLNRHFAHAPKFYGALCYEKQQSPEWKMACVTERIFGSSLASWLASSSIAPTRIAEQLCRALHELHRTHHVHGDLSSQNVMVSLQNHVTLIDFGGGGPCNRQGVYRSTIFPTLRYLAPEMVKQTREDLEFVEKTIASDLWSLGVLLAEVYQLPIPTSLLRPEQSGLLFLCHLATHWQSFLSEYQNSPKAINQQNELQLIRELLAENPQTRPTAEEVWRRLQPATSLLSRCIQWGRDRFLS